MTNEERKALVEHLRHDADDLHDFQTSADQIEADGQRIAELEREKAVVSDLLEQQKELALEYLFDCNRAAERIAELEEALVKAERDIQGYKDALAQVGGEHD